MHYVTNILIGIVALLHLYFLWLEMFVWTTKAEKVFRNFPKELFEPTKAMAANQGLYNGFLAAGLLWSFFIEDPVWKLNVSLFFLACVLLAGVYGAFTVSKKIFFIQGLPALIALVLLYVSNGSFLS
jgi:putative membrane protein